MTDYYPDAGQHPRAIETCYDPTPLPTRACDWTAARNGYEPGETVGRGCTELAAIEDLIDQEE